MPYIINKTNGQQLAIVQDATADQTTDLIFVGRNYSGYGEIQNENFLKLLEHFSNTTPPNNPILGQGWYNTSNNTLNICYAEASGTVAAKFKPLSKLTSSETSPADPNQGQMWYDTVNTQLKIWSGSEYITIGPSTGNNIKAQWRGDFEYNTLAPDIPVYNIKAVLGTNDEVIAIVSAEAYDMYETYSTSPSFPSRNANFTKIYKGITLQGAHPVTGSSTASNIYFWGTAAHSLTSVQSETANKSFGISAITTNTNDSFSVPFINTVTNVAYKSSGLTFNPSLGVLDTTASRARYADLAERYEADAIYEPGTILIIGGAKEVTVTSLYADARVAGIVSRNPAYMMNSEAGSDETHPYIALKGRVSCKVVGTINKGDLLVTSTYPGYAGSAIHPDAGTIIGKALGSNSEGFGVIEVLVV